MLLIPHQRHVGSKLLQPPGLMDGEREASPCSFLLLLAAAAVQTLVVDGYVGEETPNAVLAQIALHTALRHSLKEVKVTYRSRPALDHPGPEVWELLPLTQLHIKDTDGYKISAEAMQCLSSLQVRSTRLLCSRLPRHTSKLCQFYTRSILM